MERVFRSIVSAMIKRGCLEVETASGARFTAGDGSMQQVSVRFADKDAQLALMLNPAL